MCDSESLLTKINEFMKSEVVPFNVNVSHKIEDEHIKGLLCSALEGGSDYWYLRIKEVLPNDIKMEDFRQGGKYQDPKNYWHPYQIIPLIPGCAIQIKHEDGTAILDREQIQKGIEIMAKSYPRHFTDFIKEDDDATTGDVFLQVALLGQVVFG